MKQKRRSPLVGPVVTILLMIGSILIIGALAHLIDAHAKTAVPTDVAIEAEGRTGDGPDQWSVLKPRTNQALAVSGEPNRSTNGRPEDSSPVGTTRAGRLSRAR